MSSPSTRVFLYQSSADHTVVVFVVEMIVVGLVVVVGVGGGDDGVIVAGRKTTRYTAQGEKDGAFERN